MEGREELKRKDYLKHSLVNEETERRVLSKAYYDRQIILYKRKHHEITDEIKYLIKDYFNKNYVYGAKEPLHDLF